MLRRVARGVRSPKDPLVLTVDEHGQKALDGFLAGLHAEAGRVEGLEACWLGNGPGTVARLAGALELLGWSGLASAGRPGAIGRDHVETAAALWTSYFRPHARAVFEQAAPSNFTAQVRRAAPLAEGCRQDGGVAGGHPPRRAVPVHQCTRSGDCDRPADRGRQC